MRRRDWQRWGGIILFLFWLFYGLSAFYVAQKPFSPAVAAWLAQNGAAWARLSFSAAAWARTLLDVLTAVWLAWAALGAGLWLLSRFRLSGRFPLPPLSRLETSLYALGLGFGVLGLGVLGLGLMGLLQTAVLWAFPLLLTLFTFRQTAGFVRQIWERRPFWEKRPSLPLAIYLTLALFFAITLALLPPTSWDGLFYHLKGPKLYLAAGAIRPGVDIPHLSFPALMEMLFLLTMGIRGDTAVPLLHLFFALMLAGQAYAIARRLGVKNGWTAVLFLLAMPMTLTLATWAYNDLALAFYQVAAVTAAVRGTAVPGTVSGERGASRGWLVLGGVMAGLSMGLKYTSFVAPVTIVLLLVWEHFHHGDIKAKKTSLYYLWLEILAFSLPALLVALPWYLKNWAFTGNPVYPFLFGGAFWDEFRAAAYAGTGTGLGWDWLALLRLPHDLTLGLGDASQDGPTGPFFLIFLPLLIWMGVKTSDFFPLRTQAASQARNRMSGRPFRWLLIFALAQYLFWTMGVIFSAGLWQSRLLLPGLVALCPALALAWQALARFDHPQFSLHRFVGLTLGLALALNLVGQAADWLPRAPLAYLLGVDGRDQLLLRDLGAHYAAMQTINAQTPPDAIVQFLYEPRSYYCDRECRPDSILDVYAHLEYQYGAAAAIAQLWRETGVTHLLIFEIGLEFVIEEGTPFVAPQDTAVLDDLRQNYLTPVAQVGEAYTLYAINE